jgi:tetratricopeptide (TPR) repeat protein
VNLADGESIDSTTRIKNNQIQTSSYQLKNPFMKVALTVLVVLIVSCTFAQEYSRPQLLQKADTLIGDYHFDKALELIAEYDDSLDLALLQRKGWCYSKIGDYPRAIESYERIRAVDSLNVESLFQLGQLYSVSDQYKEAMACYQKVILVDSTNGYYFRQYASVAVKSENVIAGIGGYLQAVTLNPRDVESYAQLANIFLDAEQYDVADSMLTDILPRTQNKRLTLLLARAKMGQKKYREVVENVDALLATTDTTATYARLLGVSYFQLDEYAKVIPCMEFLMKKNVEADWVYYYLGVAFQQTHDPVKAITFLNMAVEKGISENIGSYYTQLAMAYEEAKDFKNAIRNYKAAYETSKADILLYHLARNYDVYYKDPRQAQVYYKKYLDSDDTIKLAKQYSQYRLEVLSARGDRN